ncbi:MAG: site-specific integrase, partial [Propionibacteriaceae bacterium]|nr:site-specific integrase [Propionibacteriaceae bacterium]
MARRGRPKTRRASWGSVELRPSGAFAAYYRHGGIAGVRKATIYRAPHTFSTEKAARAWLDAEKTLIDDGTWTPPTERDLGPTPPPAPEDVLTLRQYAAQWLQDNKRLRPGTRTLYERHIRLRINPSLGNVPVKELTRARVVKWWGELDQTHERTAHSAYALLRTILYAAVDDGLIDTNPAQRIRGAGKPSKRRTVDPLTPAQVQAAADAMPPRWRLGVLLGAWCGLRTGEIRELRRKDIDLKRRVVKVRRGVTRAGGQIVIGEPKTEAGIRDVGIPASMLDDVRRHLNEYTQLGDDGLLFYDTVTGLNVHDSSWRRAWLRACEAAGIEDYHFHDLRKTGLTYLALSGATVRELQVIAGHTTAT